MLFRSDRVTFSYQKKEANLRDISFRLKRGDDMLILGCDVGSDTHYVRAIDTRGRELSKSAFPFSNTLEGFQSLMDWAAKIAASNDKKQIILGLEPTGHYWFCLAT